MELIGSFTATLRIFIIIELVLMIIYLIQQIGKPNLAVKNNSSINIISILTRMLENRVISHTPLIDNNLKGISIDKNSKQVLINAKIARTPIIQNILGFFIKYYEYEFFGSLYPLTIKVLVQLIILSIFSSIWFIYPDYLIELLVASVFLLQYFDYRRRKEISEKIIQIISQNKFINPSQSTLIERYLRSWKVKLFFPI
jgi:hypothetical protein